MMLLIELDEKDFADVQRIAREKTLTNAEAASLLVRSAISAGPWTAKWTREQVGAKRGKKTGKETGA